MKNDNIDKLSILLKEMGVKTCVLHYKDKESRKNICDEVDQRAISSFRRAMGQGVIEEELWADYENKPTKPNQYYVTSALRQKKKDVFIIALRDGYYRQLGERGVNIWTEQFEAKDFSRIKKYVLLK